MRPPSPYRRHRQRAAYYRWAALRGHTLPGGDPLNGRPRGQMTWMRDESRAAYKAMARWHLERARTIREHREEGGRG